MSIVNKSNFFKNTRATFKECERPEKPADYVSVFEECKISSRYWFINDGVVRESKHWGKNVSSCSWYLDSLPKENMRISKRKYGFCEFKNFEKKDDKSVRKY